MVHFKKTLLLIVLISFVLRLYKIHTPLADWHSFRQADTASVTREYVKHGIDLLRPRYHDISNIQSGINTGGQDNVEGWRMVEFPLVNAIIASVLILFPSFDLVIVSRLFSILASLGTLIAIAYIGKELYDKNVGLVAGAIFGILPFSVFYSRSILPEPFLLCAISTSLLFFLYYQQNHRKNLVSLFVSMGLFAIALLLKPMAIFFIPAFLGITLWKRKLHGLFDLRLIIVSVLSILPLLWWREWIKQYPTGIPWSDWLYNLDGIRLRPAWWRWLFWERLTKLWLGFGGTVFFGVSILSVMYGLKSGIKDFLFSRHIVLTLWGIGMFIYMIIFATGNVRHDYYQIMLLPFVCLVVGRGIVLLLQQQSKIQNSKFKSLGNLYLAALALLIFVSLYFSWQYVKGYYSINHWEIIEAGKRADSLLPAEAKVIAPYNGDTAFLFQTNRTGWPIGFDIDTKINNGAQYYVSVNYDDEARRLETIYETVEKTDNYIILNLTKKL